MDRVSTFSRVVRTAGVAAVLGAASACGGGDASTDDARTTPRSLTATEAALQGRSIAGRDEALQIVAAGIVAPLEFTARAHALLVRAVRERAPIAIAAGDDWAPALDDVRVEIESANNIDGLLLRGESGFVRAVLHFDRSALSATARIDGAITLEVVRANAGAASAHRAQADALSVCDGDRTTQWSHLYVASTDVDSRRVVQALNVVSTVPVDGAGNLSLDTTLTPAGYVATGVLSSLNANVTLAMNAASDWTIAVDNGKDDRIDFVVQASPQQARALMGAQPFGQGSD